MKAAQISTYGDSSVVQINDIAVPSVAEGQVLVEVHASSLNPFDTSVRAGYMKEAIPLELPVTLGGDIAGTVTKVGAGVTHVAVGDMVYGQANAAAGNSGAWAEYAATAGGQVAKMPANLDFTQAAALPLVGVSALQAMKHLNVQKGQKLFIHGGGGGIGMIATQIAKNIGAYVAVTATGEGIEHAKRLGADEVIDYKTTNFTDVLSGYDAVFDTVGGDDFTASLAILKRGGMALSMIATADAEKAKSLGVAASTQSTHVTTDALNELAGLVEGGVVAPQIGKIFPLAQIQDAFKARESGGIIGKVVVVIRQ